MGWPRGCVYFARDHIDTCEGQDDIQGDALKFQVLRGYGKGQAGGPNFRVLLMV